MKRVKITAVKKVFHADLAKIYELPQKQPCCIEEGQTFISENALCPQGLCAEAWRSLSPFVLALACGGRAIFGDWMKNPSSAMVSCNDGFRPVSFLLEVVD